VARTLPAALALAILAGCGKPVRLGAIVSQSGAMATVLRAALHPRDIAISYSVSTGNEALNGCEDFLDHLIDDESTHVLLMMVEQFRHPQHLLASARKAHAACKPIVLLHPGRSAAARMSAKTHTGAMAGDYEVMRTLVSHAGVAVVDTLEELLDIGELMIRWPAPPRGGAAVISDSGAFKAMVLDFCESSDLDVPEPQGVTKAALGALAPDLILPTNPLDVTAQSLVEPNLYSKAMKPFFNDERYGSVVLAVVLSSPTHSERKMGPIIAALEECGPPKPVVFAMMGEDSEVAPELIAKLRSLGVPFFRSPERALRALARLASLPTPRPGFSARPAFERTGRRRRMAPASEGATLSSARAASRTVVPSANRPRRPDGVKMTSASSATVTAASRPGRRGG
jgi:acyl-CoA synthetase (NDP forming)